MHVEETKHSFSKISKLREQSKSFVTVKKSAVIEIPYKPIVYRNVGHNFLNRNTMAEKRTRRKEHKAR